MNEVKICPDCGSDRITLFTTYDIVVGKNVKTGKIIYKDKYPQHGSPTLCNYHCRKCEWNGETFVE